jgi:hypothetical protein
MQLIKQPTSTTCGQSCVAMLLGISLEEAIIKIGHMDITSDDSIKSAIDVDDDFDLGYPPKNIIALVKHKEPNGLREHWTVSYYGKTLDPACRGKKLWPAYKYLQVPHQNPNASR